MPLRHIIKTELARFWASFTKYDYEKLHSDGIWHRESRIVFDRGNGVGILLFDQDKETVLLTRQFRLPAYLQQHPADGYLLEVCAGKMDKPDEDPSDAARREIVEETGYHINDLQLVLEGYASPGAVTERLYLFIASYAGLKQVTPGGGLAEEQEDIELVELQYAQAYQMVLDRKILDCKTIMLLQHVKIMGLM
jgi:nudix-type nucleoside diphosphatase (YffH/AdpP family)